ncbi:hypothetical protein LTR66_009920 [Elasticomyces elasticus]|nr:hypothetical protein LTR66_009920 [Elasticomyces elasticus]KAK4985189.1 hypothetical protein LTR50_006134 [Elasticomyces elasticus]
MSMKVPAKTSAKASQSVRCSFTFTLTLADFAQDHQGLSPTSLLSNDLAKMSNVYYAEPIMFSEQSEEVLDEPCADGVSYHPLALQDACLVNSCGKATVEPGRLEQGDCSNSAVDAKNMTLFPALCCWMPYVSYRSFTSDPICTGTGYQTASPTTAPPVGPGETLVGSLLATPLPPLYGVWTPRAQGWPIEYATAGLESSTGSWNATQEHIHPMVDDSHVRTSSFGSSAFSEPLNPPRLYTSLQCTPLDPPTDSRSSTPYEQPLSFEGDLYTPRWIRGRNKQREGWCGLCSPGRWFVLKNSNFWYHKMSTHGICAATGQPLASPTAYKQAGNADMWDGLCGHCARWISLGTSSKNGTTWFRHVHKS